jgi:hypothetical protein
VSNLAAERDLRQILHVPLRHPLLDPDDQIVGIAAGQVLVDVDDLDAGFTELVPQVSAPLRRSNRATSRRLPC